MERKRKPGRLPIFDLPYEINSQGKIKSLERTIMRSNQWGSEPTPYTIKERIMKYDLKISR